MGVIRRRFNYEQTSDEIFNSETGYCTIELFNACKDAYRVAPGHKIPVPWPFVVNTTSQAAITVFDGLYEGIQKVLTSHNITTSMIGTYNLAARDTTRKAKDTVVIQTHDEPNISWKKAATEIYELVEPAATSLHIEMRVEIRNPEKMYRDVSEFIKDDATITTMTRIQPSIVAAVKQYCPPGRWSSIAYHARGVPSFNGDSDKKPTIIVFIQPGTMYAWGVFEEAIGNIIRSTTFQGEASICLEILPGRISPAQPSERPKQYRSLSSIPMIPTIGSSIAPGLCRDAAGTLGPVVNYRAAGDEEAKKCFLTCYHVIESGDPTGKETNDLHGVGINGRQIDVHVNIHYPAEYDSQETRWFQNTRGTQQGTDVIRRLDDLAARGPIGRVKFASGYRVLDNRRRMDWALVELDPTLPVQNLLPMEDQFKDECFYGCPDYTVQEGETVSGINYISKNTWYGKVGRSTGCTAAEFNMIQRNIAWPNGMFSDEHEFKSLHSDEEFAKGGDSGSLVFNIDKEWVGMLFASGSGGECGFVTPVHELIKDIEETTGGKVELA